LHSYFVKIKLETEKDDGGFLIDIYLVDTPMYVTVLNISVLGSGPV
jgi:6-pyruvoyl-tetrahydropterin synthase